MRPGIGFVRRLGSRGAIERPCVLASMVRDIQAMAAGASQGFAQDRSFRARGWRPPAPPWPRMERGSSAVPGVEDAFAMIPGARFAVLPEAGHLVYHAHPEAVAEMFADHAGTEIAA